MFKLVHLSDFHYKSNIENDERITRLIEDISEQVEGTNHYIVFSGDLVHAGDNNLFGSLFDNLLAPLSK